MTRRLAALALATACTAPTAVPQTSMPALVGEAGTDIGKPRASRSRPAPRVLRLSVTAYTYTGSRTASGLWPAPGMAASNQFALGTRLLVEGVGVVQVQDRVGWGTSLDIFLTTVAACREFGRRELRVEVIS